MITPDILANIKFYSTENGGRNLPTPSTFFGCVFVINESNHDGRLLLDEIGSIFPGETKNNVPIKFLCADLVIPKLKVGAKFYIRDGSVVGEGRVADILNKNPENSEVTP